MNSPYTKLVKEVRQRLIAINSPAVSGMLRVPELCDAVERLNAALEICKEQRDNWIAEPYGSVKDCNAEIDAILQGSKNDT